MNGAGDVREEESTEELQVEVEGEDGSKFTFENGDKAIVFGRGSGFNTDDRTVCRRHISFQLESEIPRVSFQVIGRNPIWVYTNKDGEEDLKLFRKFEKGHLDFGDRFCLSPKKPLWFHLKKGSFQINVSGIDPVKEFGFLVIGHEFDHYPKGMIRNVKDWEWFLEEPSKDSEDEEESGKERRKMKRKRKKHKDNEDEEWTGESEDDKDLVAGMRKGKTPKYSTRSKDKNKGPNRDTKASSNSKQKKATSVNESDGEEEEDDDDETLGGFIITDEEDDMEEDNEDEEEEFEDDDDDDEVDD